MKTTKTITVSLHMNRQARKSGLRRGFLAASAAALLGLGIAPQSVTAAPAGWNGSNANWQNAASWTPAGIPISSTQVTFSNVADPGLLNLNATLGAGAVADTLTAANAAWGFTGGTLALTTGTIDVGTGAQVTFFAGGSLTGAGGITKTGAGILLFDNANSYTGATVVNGGRLDLTNVGTFGNGNSAMTIGAAGNVNLQGVSASVASLSGAAGGVLRNLAGAAATLTINGTNGAAVNYAGALQDGGAGALSMVKNGAGIQALSGNNTYTGGTTLNAGTLALNSATAIGTGALTITGGALDNTSGGAITLSTNNAQNWNGNFSFTGTNALNLGTGAVTMNASRTVNVVANTLTVGGAISGPGFGLTKAGNGTLILSGTSTYTGATAVQAGHLQIGNGLSGNLSGASPVTVDPGAFLDLNLANGATFANNVLNSGTVAGINTSGTQTVGGVITGIGNFVQGLNGAVSTPGGTTVFANINTYQGGTRITGTGSTLTIGTAVAQGSAGNAAISIENGGFLNLVNVNGDVLGNNISNNVGGTGTVTAALAFETRITGTIRNGVGTIAVTQNGPGTLILANSGDTSATAYSGATTVIGGTLQIGTAALTGAIGTASAVDVRPNGRLLLVNVQGNLLTNNVTNSTPGFGTLEVKSANTNTLSGVLSNGGGILTLIQSGTGTTILTANNTFSGDAQILGGVLQVGNGGATGTAGVGNGGITNNATLTYFRSDAYSETNLISGTGVVNQNGNSLTLTRANTYSGVTNVNAGTLILGNDSALGTAAGGTVVANGATLDLSGRTIGAEAVQLQGTGSAGNTGALVNNNAGTPATLGGAVTMVGNTTIGTPGDITLNGVVSGNFSLTKVGAGVLTLNGINNYSGTTNVNAGIVVVGNASALGSIGASTTVANGAALSIANGIIVGTEPLFINGAGAGAAAPGALTQAAGGTSTYTGPITAQTDSTINANGGTLTITGGINKNAVNLTLAGTAAGGTINIRTVGITGAAPNSDLIVESATVNEDIANNYDGKTFIRSTNGAGLGVLNAGVANALPTASGRSAVTMDDSGLGSSTLNIAGTTLNPAGANQSIASLTGAASSKVTLGTNTLTIGTAAGSTTFAGVISDTQAVNSANVSILKDGASTEIFSGANTYHGATQINAGILSLQNGAAIADTSKVIVTAPGTLDLLSDETIGSLAGSGFVTLNAQKLTTGGNNDTTTFSGVMSGNGTDSLVKTGTGTFTLSGANTFTGTAVVNQGILQLQNGAAIADAVAVTVTSPGSLDLLTSETIGSLAGNGNVTLNARTLTTGGNNGTTTYSGIMSGNGAASLIKTGTGTMTLSGANTFTGTAVVNQGILSLQNGAAIADAVAVTVTNPGILNLVNSETIGSLAGNGNTTLNANTLTTGGNNGTTTYSGIMSGTGANALVKNGTGTMTLSGANTFTGTAVVNDGTLSLSGGAAIANTVAVTVNDPVGVQFGILNLVNSETIGSLAGAGNVTLNAQTLTTGGNNTSTTFSGIMSGNGANSLVKTGTGTMTLSGANTFTGTAVVNQGILSLTGGAAIADAVAVTVTAPGSLNLASSETIGSLAGSGTTTLNANSLTTGGNNGTTTYSGVMSGTGGLTKLGTGTMTLSGANTFSGLTAVNAGILSLTGGAALADTSAVTVTAPGTLNLVTSETIASLAGTGAVTLNAQTLTTGVDNTSTTHSGVISGAGGALVKNGTGTFTVAGANTYTGGTTLNAGTLAAANGSAFGNGNLTVNGGTLRTSGGPLVVNIGAGNVQFNAGTYLANVGGTLPGVNHDQLTTTGSANPLGGTLALVQQNGYLLAPGDKVNLLVATGGVTGGSANGTAIPNASITGLAAFSITPLLVPTVNAYLTSVTLEAMQGSFLALAPVLGLTPNQRAVAGALDSVAAKNLFKTGLVKELDFLDVQSLSTLPGNLDKIAPEELTSIFHLGVALANVNSNNLVRRMDDIRSGNASVPSAPSAPFGNGKRFVGGANGPTGKRSQEIAPPNDAKWGAFLTGSGEFTHIGSTSNAAGYNLNTGGVTAGADYRVSDKLAVGLSLGYANTTASLVNGGSLDADGGRLGIYATYFDQNFHLDASVTGGINSYRSRRVTPNNTVATGSPDGTEINVMIGAGYDFKFGALTVGPIASYQYTNMRMDGFTESGAFAPLTVSGQSADSSRTSLGIRASFEGRIGSAIIRPEVRLAWQHEFGGTSYAITSRFATIGGNPFTVTGTKVGRDSLLASAGFIIMWNERLGTYVYYDGNIGAQNLESHNISGGVRFQF